MAPLFPGSIGVRFDSPIWLAAGLLAFGPIVQAWRRRKQQSFPPKRVVPLQSLALLLAAVSLAEPVVTLSLRRPCWLILRDVSASVARQAEQPLPLPAETVAESCGFAGRLLGETEQDAPNDETRLGPALEWARAAIFHNQADGVFLLTDGQFQDDWRAAARRYAQTRAPLWIVPLNTPPPDARLTDFHVQNEGKSSPTCFPCRLTIRMESTAALRRELAVYRLEPGGAKRERYRGEVFLEPRQPLTIHLREEFSSPAEAAFWEARLSPHDAFGRNDVLRALRLPETPRIAWIGKPVAGAAALAARGEWNVQTLAPSEAPRDPTGWLSFRAAVLADATGKLLSPSQRKALAEYVRAGGGLVLLGAGPHETPADRNDPLPRVLPLRADVRQRRPLDLTVVLDTSGSMAEADSPPAKSSKGSRAVQAVLTLREHLTPEDTLRVVVFSDLTREVYSAGPGKGDFAALGESLRSLSPSGPTHVAPALEYALQHFSGGIPSARIRLVLVLSDLRTAPFDSAAMAEAFRRVGAHLAVAAIGSRKEARRTPLADLAKRLRAPLAYRRNLADLAEVFARFCRRVRGPAIQRGDFPVRYESDWPDFARPASLRAYLLSAAAENAHVSARVAPAGDPLLATGSAGLGRAAVIACPPEEFFAFPETATEWIGELLRRVARSEDDRRGEVWATRRGNDLHLRVSVREEDRPINGLTLRAKVVPPGAKETAVREAAVLPSAPGEYETTIPRIGESGEPLAVEIRDTGGTFQRRILVPGGYPAEFARLGADFDTLRALAEISGGRILSAIEEISSPTFQKELRRGHRGERKAGGITLACSLAAMLAGWVLPRGRGQSDQRRRRGSFAVGADQSTRGASPQMSSRS